MQLLHFRLIRFQSANAKKDYILLRQVPTAWNSLPEHLKNKYYFSTFKSKLTYFFNITTQLCKALCSICSAILNALLFFLK